MSEVIINKCDCCGKSTENKYWTYGWINATTSEIGWINATTSEIYIRQTLEHNSETNFHKGESFRFPSDICSKKCFLEWVDATFK